MLQTQAAEFKRNSLESIDYREKMLILRLDSWIFAWYPGRQFKATRNFMEIQMVIIWKKPLIWSPHRTNKISSIILLWNTEALLNHSV